MDGLCLKPIAPSEDCRGISFAAGFDGFDGLSQLDGLGEGFGGIHAGVEAFGHFVHPAAAPGIGNAAATRRPEGEMSNGGLGGIFDQGCAGAPADFFLKAQRVLIGFALKSNPNAGLGTIAVAIGAVVLPQLINSQEVVAGKITDVWLDEIAPIELSTCFEHESGGDGVGFFPVAATEEVLQGAVVEKSIGF